MAAGPVEDPIRSAGDQANYGAHVDLHVSLVGRRDVTGQIYGQLREAIVSGVLAARRSAASDRELAARLAVSRTTVTVAYDRLAGEGFLSSRVGAGTFVSDDVPTTGPGRRLPPACCDHCRSGSASSMPRRRPDGPLRLPTRAAGPDAVPVRAVAVAGDAPAHAGIGCAAPGYGEPAGHEGLRAAIARHIGASRAVRATAADVVVTNGIQQAVDLIARTLLSPGDRVAVEDPGYPPPRAQLTHARGPARRRSGRRRGHRRRCDPADTSASSSSRHRTSSRSASRCPCAAGSPSCAGPRSTTRRSSRTTTTASSASAAARSSRCRASTRPGACSTPGRSRRRCCPRCGSGSW